jgi:Fic family protein
MNVRVKNDISQWIKFFLTRVIETAKNSIETFEKILELKSATESRILKLGTRSGNAQKILEYLYKKPLVDAPTVAGVTSISLPSAYTLISDLEKLGILIEATGGKRNRYYLFEDYLKLYR